MSSPRSNMGAPIIPVGTTAGHGVFLVGTDDGTDVVLHDTRLGRSDDQSVVDATLEALGLPGSLNGQCARGIPAGLELQTTPLHHYRVDSVAPGIIVSSARSMLPRETRTITRTYLDWLAAREAAAKKVRP